MKRPTDKERLDWLLEPGRDCGVRDIRPGAAYNGCLWFDNRRELDAAMKARRKA